MDYRMPWRSVEPLESQWDGELYNFVDYVLEKLRGAWEWDDPDGAAKMAAALTPSQLALWAIINAGGEVCNGGFSQFFFNSSGELAEEALQGFHLFGMKEYADLFEQAYANFPERPIPKDRDLRIEMLEDMADEDDPDGKHAPAAPELLQVYSGLAKATEERWEQLESQYYKLIHREDVPGGYYAAFFRPLIDFIEAHPEEFFLPQSNSAS